MVKPFIVDPEVMGRMRVLRPEHAADVARLHHAAMGDSLWARLGVDFLKALYLALLRHPSFLGYVYVEDGRVRGFIAGSEHPSALMRQTFVRRGHRLVRPLLRGLRRDPSLLGQIAQTGSYFGRSGAQNERCAESMFCSFEPSLRGRRVSGHINKVLFDELALRGHSRVKVTTEADNVGANRQLLSWGFQDRGTFEFYGKAMVTYVLDLEQSARVEGRRWVGPF